MLLITFPRQPYASPATTMRSWKTSYLQSMPSLSTAISAFSKQAGMPAGIFESWNSTGCALPSFPASWNSTTSRPTCLTPRTAKTASLCCAGRFNNHLAPSASTTGVTSGFGLGVTPFTSEGSAKIILDGGRSRRMGRNTGFGAFSGSTSHVRYLCHVAIRFSTQSRLSLPTWRATSYCPLSISPRIIAWACSKLSAFRQFAITHFQDRVPPHRAPNANQIRAQVFRVC
jgi:hypothetical protein